MFESMQQAQSQVQQEKVVFNIQAVVEDCREKRTANEVARQRDTIITLSNENMRNFKIVEDDTSKVSSVNRSLRKYENPETKWYCYYTDNLEDLGISVNQLELPDITILALHGGAFDFREFSKLETGFGEKTCRWINFAYPGYDGFDDKRGSYTGSVKDECRLIAEMLDSLKIRQVLFLGHSFGGYLRNYFTLMYPQRVIATVSIATHSFNHNIGFRSWVECIERPIREYQISHSEVLHLLKDDNKKEEIANIIQESFRYMRENFGVQLIDIDQNKISNQIRILYQQDHPIEFKETFLYLNPNIPHLISFGVDDPLIPLDKQTETIYYLQNHPNRKSFKLRKTPEIQQILKDIDFDYEKEVFFDNFLFMFEKCGHVPHLKRANELGFSLQIFARLINHLNSTNQLPHLIQTFPKL